MNKYSVTLLFQYKVNVNGAIGKRRICEESMRIIKAINTKKALNIAKKIGKEEQHHYLNDEGNKVQFQFIGITDLLHLGLECSKDEVWYNVKEMLNPMERKKDIIPNEKNLCAIRNERKNN